MPRQRKPIPKPDDNTPRSAVFYVRVSTEEQASEDHFSIPAQIKEMQAQAQRKNWQVVATFADEGISGTTDKRPGFQAALDLIRSGEADLLVVHDLSRLARSIHITLDTIELLDQHNASLASVSEPDFDFSSPMGRMMIHIIAMLNQYYVEMLRFHTRKGKHQRAREGLYNASRIPYGYRITGDPHTPPDVVPDEAKVVYMAFEQYATGRFSDREIAEKLSAAGFRRHPSRKYPNGAPFTKENVAAMLQNPFYKGKIYYSPTGEYFDGRHTPIIDEDLWQACQIVRERRRGASRAVQPQFRPYLLSLLGYCDVCGISLRAQTIAKSGQSYYRELSRQRGQDDCPHRQTGTRTEPIDRQMDAIIRSIRIPADWLDQAQARLGSDEELLRAQRERESLLARRKRLRTLFLNGDFGDDLDAYTRERKAIETRLRQLPSEEQLVSLRQVAEAVQDLPETWAQADTRDRNELLHTMLHKVEIDVARSRVTALHPKAVFIPIFRAAPFLHERDFGVFIPRWPLEQTAWSEDPNQRLFTLPPLPPVEHPGEQQAAAPFLVENFLAPAGNARMTPAIAKALTFFHQSGSDPRSLLQIEHPGLSPLPMDARKHPGLQAALSPATALPPDSADVLVAPFFLWQAYATGQSTLPVETLRHLFAALRPGGALYLQDILPQDMPAHWLYAAFPPAWNWAQHSRRGLHALYADLQLAGFAIRKIIRHPRHQAVRADAALALARSRPAPLDALDDRAFRQGLDFLADQGEALLPSEVAAVEVWAQRGR